MKINHFDKYIKTLLKSSVNAFSAVSFIILLLAYFLPIDLSAKTQITGFLAFLCIIYSGYRVWEKDAGKILSGYEFKIISKDSSFRPHAFLGDGSLDSNSNFTIDFDFINRLDQTVILYRPEVSLLKIDGGLISTIPTSIYFKHLPNTYAAIDFPYSILKDSRQSIRCEINVSFLVTDKIEFAEKLRELNEYEIAVQLSYEDMMASMTTETIKVTGNFDGFKQEILNFWKEKKQFELICKANGNA